MSDAGSYIKNETLMELSGRLKFVNTPLEDHLRGVKDPPKPPVSVLHTPMDEQCIKLFGVDKNEANIMLEHAGDLAVENEMIANKLRELFQLTKLCGGDSLSLDLRKYREKQEARRDQILNADKKYGGAIKANKAKREHLEKSWNEVHGQVRTRWKRVLKGLAAALAKYEFFADLHKRDQQVLLYLWHHHENLVEIANKRVTKFDWEALEHVVEIEKINYLVGALLDSQHINPNHVPA